MVGASRLGELDVQNLKMRSSLRVSVNGRWLTTPGFSAEALKAEARGQPNQNQALPTRAIRSQEWQFLKRSRRPNPGNPEKGKGRQVKPRLGSLGCGLALTAEGAAPPPHNAHRAREAVAMTRRGHEGYTSSQRPGNARKGCGSLESCPWKAHRAVCPSFAHHHSLSPHHERRPTRWGKDGHEHQP